MSVTGPEEPIDPASVPLPDEADDLIAEHDTQDFWEQKEDCLIRHHVIPRLRLFMPSDSVTCPWPLEDLGIRITKGVFRDKNVFQDQEPWWDHVHAHRYLTDIWTGTTTFMKNKQPRSIEHACQVEPLLEVDNQTGLPIEIVLSAEEIAQCCQKKYADQAAYLASQAKRQKVEVRTHELNPDEKKQFLGAKHKEVDQWLATETVRRIARHKIPEENLLKTRWVLSWKQLDSQEQLDDEWPESIFHHVGSQSVSYLLSVQCEVLSRVS